MSGVNGNPNLLYLRRHQFITMDGSSDTITLDASTRVVTLYATVAAWVAFGTNPTAAAVAEKTASAPGAFFLPAGLFMDIPLPVTGTPAAPIKIAVIQGGSGGDLHAYERSEV